MKKLLLTIPFLLAPSIGMAGEKNTTWRAGDLVRIPGYCVTHEAAATLAIAPDAASAQAVFISGGCRAIHPRLVMMTPPVELGEWLSHHYDPMNDEKLSVWKSGEYFLLLEDDAGPHEAEPRI